MTTEPTPPESEPQAPAFNRDDITVTDTDDDADLKQAMEARAHDSQSGVFTEEPEFAEIEATASATKPAAGEGEDEDDGEDGDPDAAAADVSAEADKPAKAAAGGEAEKGSEAGDDKPKSRRARKTARLQKENAELRDRVAALESASREPPTPDAEPTKPELDDFPSYEAYGEALGKYEFEKLKRENAPAQGASDNEAVKPVPPAWGEVADKYDDFDEVVYNDKNVFFTVSMVNSMIDMGEEGAEVAYYLGNHPEEAKRIAEVTGETAIARELTKAAMRASGESKATGNGGQPRTEKAADVAPTITSAPEPFEATRGGGAHARPLNKETAGHDDYRAQRRREMDSRG